MATARVLRPFQPLRPLFHSLHHPLHPLFISARTPPHHRTLASKHPKGFVPPPQADLDELRERVQEFTRRELTEEVAAATDKTNSFPADMWQKLGSAGFLGITADEDVGGLGLGYQAHCVVMEELSRASGSVALSYAAHSQLCVNQLQLHGTAAQKAAHMPGLIAGTTIGALAMSETGAGSDVVSMRTTAREAVQHGRNGYVLRGSKMWITNGPDAGLIVVYAKTRPDAGSKGITAFLVDTAARPPGFACARKLDKMGMRGSNTGELVFDDVFVPCSHVLGTVDGGARVLMAGLDLERLVLSAGPLGLMQAALDLALPYTHQRHQFGVPVASFQLVQGRLADMHTKLQASRAYTYATARRVDDSSDIRTEDCAGTILYAAERATEVALDCIQLLGGMGYMEEMPASRILRDAKLYEIGAGTSEIRRMVIGRAFNKQPPRNHTTTTYAEEMESGRLHRSTHAATGGLPVFFSTSTRMAAAGTMKAFIYESANKARLLDHPRPQLLEPTDAVVRVQKTTICGTDLHICKGDVATCSPGRVLGHEGVGVVEEVGSSVKGVSVGDRVLISCVSSCSSCHYCRRGMYSHCETGGWILGNSIDGTMAEHVRVPHAQSSLYVLPADTTDDDAGALVMLSDIFPTGHECGVQNARVQPGSTVVVVGAGPVGLAALITAQLYSPAVLIAIDMDENRLRVAREMGAHHTINNGGGAEGAARAVEQVRALTGGIGCDSVLEAVGLPASFELCQQLLAPGGVLANVGVHGTGVTLHLEKLWDHNISVTTRLVDTATLPMLLKLVQARRLNPAQLITHKFKFSEMEKAYDTFRNASKHSALKVLVEMD
ncbi:isovaleryl-dehydrogenase [Grosmannia clavigera kw1407]|uniref:Isovaleryl-dehydrogenase n=1 Tax=Grosmannia clavigera (strain kw1407 / UAMH 11150) TaxID=655863 RepID=F0XK47_GROCL|nr:isovaleryl-dehydrogenase [Grosmannia clavigera kw1407]EFX01968.1 isovaleryl-dehydrogenase [Grosmannia clavigera kw1407]